MKPVDESVLGVLTRTTEHPQHFVDVLRALPWLNRTEVQRAIATLINSKTITVDPIDGTIRVIPSERVAYVNAETDGAK